MGGGLKDLSLPGPRKIVQRTSNFINQTLVDLLVLGNPGNLSESLCRSLLLHYWFSPGSHIQNHHATVILQTDDAAMLLQKCLPSDGIILQHIQQ